MIDRRTIKNQNEQIDEHLQTLSDTEIMLEFSRLLTSIFPHLVKTHNHCYDPFDNIAESLFFNFVHSTFSGKYGARINSYETHKYGFSLYCYRHINHVSIIPKDFPFRCESSQGPLVFEEENQLKGKEFVFLLFGDKENYLSGDSDQVAIEKANFDFVNFEITDILSGLTFRNQDTLWVDKNLVNFELVLEDFDKTQHEFHRPDTYADSKYGSL